MKFYNYFGATAESVLDILKGIVWTDLAETETEARAKIEELFKTQTGIILSSLPREYLKNIKMINGEIIYTPAENKTPLQIGIKSNEGTTVAIFKNYSLGENRSWCDRKSTDRTATGTIGADGLTIEQITPAIELTADDWVVVSYDPDFLDGLQVLKSIIENTTAYFLSVQLYTDENAEKDYIEMLQGQAMQTLDRLTGGKIDGKDNNKVLGIYEIDALKLWDDPDGGACELKGANYNAPEAFTTVNIARG